MCAYIFLFISVFYLIFLKKNYEILNQMNCIHILYGVHLAHILLEMLEPYHYRFLFI